MENNSEPEFTKELKVKADGPNVSSETRKTKVKKLAGAIAHSLRTNGEVHVRCFGNACIGKACKAIAISSSYVAPHGLSILCTPYFIEAEMDGQTKTGIAFRVFAE
mgnify:CR=1 FL=1